MRKSLVALALLLSATATADAGSLKYKAKVTAYTVDGEIHGARAVLPRLLNQETPLGRWVRSLSERAHKNIVVVALAAKLARIVWAVLKGGRPFDATIAAA